MTTTKLAGKPGVGPQQSTSKLFRSSDGKVRVDSGNTSVITDPVARKTIILDHVKKEAGIFPMDVQAPKPGSVGVPAGAPPSVPTNPPRPLKVEDLGKRFIDGHEVEGKRYTLPPLAPAPVQTPSWRPPNAPEAPRSPDARRPTVNPPTANPPAVHAPAVDPSITRPPDTVSEVWTSTKLHLPVLTKTTGGFGEQDCHCKYTDSGEPAPSLFQIPTNYKPVDMGAVPKPPVINSIRSV